VASCLDVKCSEWATPLLNDRITERARPPQYHLSGRAVLESFVRGALGHGNRPLEVGGQFSRQIGGWDLFATAGILARPQRRKIT
jgi:hypothetical protein